METMEVDLVALSAEEIGRVGKARIPALVSAYVALDRLTKEYQDKIDAAKARLVQEAERFAHEEGFDELKGTGWDFTGTDGNVARVNFPEDKIVSAIEEKDVPRMERIAGDKFDNLFCRIVKPAKAFRELCVVVLSPAKAKQLIELCSEASKARVTPKTKTAGVAASEAPIAKAA